jgi:hypothetical protein
MKLNMDIPKTIKIQGIKHNVIESPRGYVRINGIVSEMDNETKSQINFMRDEAHAESLWKK